MRIVVVGGLAKSLINFRGPLLREMIERGHEVVACAPKACDEVKGMLEQIGVRYCHIPIARAGLNPIKDSHTVRYLKHMFLAEQPDRVLAYTVKPVIYSCLAAKGSETSKVYAMITGLGYGLGNGSSKQKVIGYGVRFLYRRALTHSAGVFFQNPDDQGFFEEFKLVPSSVPVTLINGSGVDRDWFTPQPIPREPIFLLIARLLAEKGVREYYEAARELKEEYPEAVFKLAGYRDPNPSSVSREELKRWQDEGVIEFLGELDDVRPAYASAQVYVLPSYREGTPRTVLEAMAVGRPIITTDTPGCRETVVNGDNGFLVQVRDVRSLRSAMETFIKRPELAGEMSRASLRMVSEKYDVKDVNRIILDAMRV